MSKVKSFFKCSEELKNQFAHSNCQLTISVGQSTHEGEIFASTMELINESFAGCTILLGDSLQRYNMAINYKQEPDFFYKIAVKEGDLWLERNKKYYSQITIPLNIIRWDVWLKHPGFTYQLNNVRRLLKEDPRYQAVFDHSITSFVKRYQTRVPNLKEFDFERAYLLSYDYTVEECAALCLWPELKCQFEAYPIQHNEAMNATRKRFVMPKCPDLLQEINILYKHVKQINPQRFILLENIQMV